MRNVRFLRKPRETKLTARGIACQNELIALVERRLAQESEIREAVMRSHMPDVYHSAPCPTGGDGSGHALIDDPTASLALRSACPLEEVTIEWQDHTETIEEPEAWLAVFDTVRHAGDAICRELIRRRYSGEPYHVTCRALYLSTSTYYHHVREILHYTLACAIYAGLLCPHTSQVNPVPKKVR